MRALGMVRTHITSDLQTMLSIAQEVAFRDSTASGFGPSVAVAAKSGGLMGIVRNEPGGVTFPDSAAYAVAIFTRTGPNATRERAAVDAGIGTIARALIDRLRPT